VQLHLCDGEWSNRKGIISRAQKSISLSHHLPDSHKKSPEPENEADLANIAILFQGSRTSA
jgi:hypothetical protein